MRYDELAELFRLAGKLYEEVREQSGMAVIPCAWAKNDETGEFLAFSAFGVPSKQMEACLKREFSAWQGPEQPPVLDDQDPNG